MCNHYLWYFYNYEWIEEVRQNSELKEKQWIWFLDRRKNWGFRFDYCPLCWVKFDRLEMLKDIKNQFKLLKIKSWIYNLEKAKNIAIESLYKSNEIVDNYKWIDIYETKKELINFSRNIIKENLKK